VNSPSAIFRDDLLAGQVAIVTGGGTGIGAAITRELTRVGARVVIASRDAAKLERAATGLTAELGRAVVAERCDIRDRGSVDELVERTLARHGRIDLLVNNGGGQFFSPAELIRPNGFDAVIATNLTGTWNLTRAVADAWMLSHGGGIVNITMLTQRGFPGMAHSVAARAGVAAMTRTLAVEWASRGVRVNCVAPGLVASSGLNRYPPELDVLGQMQRHVPLKRLARPEEIAWAVAYLASPAGAYVTGQTWTVDGGKELWGDWWPIPDPEGATAATIPPEPWETD
jgi:citronellol/citronellal dehydrogenase